MTAVVAGAAILLASSVPARAEFAICNQTFDVVNVAISQRFGDIYRTEGWWTIGSNQCAAVIREELRNRYIYVYAIDVFGQPLLDGTESMCIGENRFSIDGIDSCWKRGYRAAAFTEIDTRDAPRWTVFLNTGGEPATTPGG